MTSTTSAEAWSPIRGSVNRRVANVTTVGQEAIQSFGEMSGKKSSQPIDGSSKTDNREFFSLIARPEEMSADNHGHILPITEGVRKFPHPEAVAGMYKGLRGLMKFSALPPLLMGRQRGPTIKPHNLVPACVAWHLFERGRLLGEHGTISQVTKILDVC